MFHFFLLLVSLVHIAYRIDIGTNRSRQQRYLDAIRTAKRHGRTKIGTLFESRKPNFGRFKPHIHS